MNNLNDSMILSQRIAALVVACFICDLANSYIDIYIRMGKPTYIGPTIEKIIVQYLN